MSFKDIHIELSYETGQDDPVNEFYVPLLAEAKYYDRIAGISRSAPQQNLTFALYAICTREAVVLVADITTARKKPSPHGTAEQVTTQMSLPTPTIHGT